MIIHLIVGLIKNMFYENESVFLKPYKSFGGEINVKDDLSDYATKADLKNAARVDTSKQQNLIWLAEVDKIDIEQANQIQKRKLQMETKQSLLLADFLQSRL